MAEKRQIQFERYTNLPLGGNWAGEWPAYVLVHHESAVDDVRYVPERTCRMVSAFDTDVLEQEQENVSLSPEDTLAYRCEGCGFDFRYDRGLYPSYCPNCGARVVNDARD